jgi:hypothetical protein
MYMNSATEQVTSGVVEGAGSQVAARLIAIVPR